MATINPEFLQLGYVTNDLKKAMAYFRDAFAMPDFHIWPDADVHMELYGKPAHAVLTLGFAWRADTMIEIIVPVSGAVDHYMPGIEGPDFGLRLHHVGAGVKTEAEFDARLNAGVAAGSPLVNVSRPAMGSYCLLDDRKASGLYREYLWNTQQGLDFFAGIPRSG
jgi:hypothetical protein